MAPSSPSGGTTSVQVAVRIRPGTQQDISSIPTRFQRVVVHQSSPTSVSIDPSSAPGAAPGQAAGTTKKQQFNFDQVHSPSTSQHSVFTSTAQPLISRFLEGYNCTILAYGQTSSGKTYTMTGVDLDADPKDPTNGMGIIPRAVSTIFTNAQAQKEEKAGGWKYSVKGSFIEIYNEELIDLLSDGSGREVHIREDKNGHIIWDGLREMSVKSSSEVMELLRQGGALRRTSETDMNAQSSRSHAIFSLTLTQQKWTGSGAPPRSGSPLPTPSPSRLSRPGSVYTQSRVASPTFGGRPSTPSFASAMGRTLRPASSLGIHNRPKTPEDDGTGSWSTIVSKFHFVDLAGSERLKRTAAVGDRAKEGISINGGLLALGNVISALGDPARARSGTTAFVPYRDSKLTRLLQDSLGGNAHTLMVACVSPAEWNVSETINTLKYANRARNIRNRAEVKEREDGWDDLDWLQNMVTKLRGELKTIKEDGGIPSSTTSTPRPSIEVETGAQRKVMDQMVALQGSYEELREKYTDRTEELARLRRELGDKRDSVGGAVGGAGKYEEIVGPVIEEYEKTIGAMEAELTLNRAALRHTNSMFAEKEEEFTALADRHTATEAYVEELRTRVGKLTEREASTESYVRDLEQKLKVIDESSLSSSSSVADLKKEISRYKAVESHSAQHIADLEARLARSDESVLELRATVETLESDAETRRAQVELLELQLEALKQDSDGWRASLEEREKTVSALEDKLKEWEKTRMEVGEERLRLGSVVGNVAKARQSLEIEVAQANKAMTNGNDTAELSDTTAQAQLLALQQTHTATLADLSAVTNKYRDALREISDLAGQIEEAKLQTSQQADAADAAASPDYEGSFGRRRGTLLRRDTNDSQMVTNRRLFFRQAASTESLHARSLSQSQSLSQELSSARTPKHSLTSSNGISTSLITNPNALNSPPLTPKAMFPNSPTTHERSVGSLEKEIMRLQEVLKERENEIGVLEESLKKQEKKKESAAKPVTPPLEESESEAEGGSRLSPTMMNKFAQIRRSLTFEHPPNFDIAPEDTETLDRLDELMRSMAQKESHHREVVDDLDGQLTRVRKDLDDLTTLSRDQAHNMSNEMEGLRSQLRQAESEHGSLAEELEGLRQKETALLEERRVADEEHASALQELRQQHSKALQAQADESAATLKRAQDEHERLRAEQEATLQATGSESAKRLSNELAAASLSLVNAQHEHEVAFARLRNEHQSEIERRQAEMEGVVSKTTMEHDDAVAKILADHMEASMNKARETDALLAKIRAEHEASLEQARTEHSGALQQHEMTLMERQVAIKMSLEEDIQRQQAEAHQVLERTRQEHTLSVDKIKAEHDEALSRKADEAQKAVDRLREEHAAELKQAVIAREGSLSESQEAQAESLKSLRDEHMAAMERKEKALGADMETLKAENVRTLAALSDDHSKAIAQLQSDHATTCTNLQAELARQTNETEHMKQSLKKSQEDLDAARAAFREELAAALDKAKTDHATTLQDFAVNNEKLVVELKATHATTVAELKAQQEATIAESKRALEAHQAAAAQSLLAEVGKVKATHDQALAQMESEYEANIAQAALAREKQWSSQEHSRSSALAEAKGQHDVAIAEVRAELAAALAQHQATVEEARLARERALAEQRTLHEEALRNAKQAHDVILAEQHTLHAEQLAQQQAMLEQAKKEREDMFTEQKELHATVLADHQRALENASGERNEKLQDQETEHATALAKYQSALDETRQEHQKVLAEQEERHIIVLKDMQDMHEQERETFHREQSMIAEELNLIRDAAEESENTFAAELERLDAAHQATIGEQALSIANLGQELTAVQRERREIANEAYRLQSELDQALREGGGASNRDSLAQELENYRAALADTQNDLQKRKDEVDALQMERARQDAVIQDIQQQLAEPPTARASPVAEVSRGRMNGSSSKLPPITPPPSMPPPPLPTALPPLPTDSMMLSRSATSSSQQSHTDSTAPTSIIYSSTDGRLVQQLEEQIKLGEEQDAMIKTLNKQLSHCEGDLQAHMDLVATLETSLSDSERNLRKARAQATEIAKERDVLMRQTEELRSDVQTARKEVDTVRRSVVEEKQSLEQRLDEERKAKERARQQLEVRMEELQKRKSKYVCM